MSFKSPEDDDVEINFDKLKHETKKAMLFDIAGDDFWVPMSQIVDVDKADKIVTITKWIAEEKGLA